MAQSKIMRTCSKCGYRRMALPQERACPLCNNAYTASTRYLGAAAGHDRYRLRSLALATIVGVALATELKYLMFPDMSWRAYGLIFMTVQILGLVLPQDAKRAKPAEIRGAKSLSTSTASKPTFGR